jgi:hypothetical protein
VKRVDIENYNDCGSFGTSPSHLLIIVILFIHHSTAFHIADIAIGILSVIGSTLANNLGCCNEELSCASGVYN